MRHGTFMELMLRNGFNKSAVSKCQFPMQLSNEIRQLGIKDN